MKRLILAFGLLMTVKVLWAGSPPSVWISSFTTAPVTTQNLCGVHAGITTNRRGFFHGVCTSSGATNGFITVYNSSGSAINPMAIVNSISQGCQYFDVVASTVNKGLTYSTVGGGNYTILYDCY